jgi:basic membrane protein A
MKGGEKMGEALLAKGCDIIFIAAGECGNGGFEAVKTAVKNGSKAKVIGCDMDQYNFGRVYDKNIVLMSATNDSHTTVSEQLQKIADGTFEGGNHMLNVSSGAITFTGPYYPTMDSKLAGNYNYHNQLSNEVINKLRDVFHALEVDGIIPPSVTNAYSVKDFPGL